MLSLRAGESIVHSAPLLVIRALGKRFRAGVSGCWVDARALVDVNLDIRRGEIVALVGAGAAGKTTLLRCAGRLLVPDEGLVEHVRGVDGRESVVRYFDHCVQAERAAVRGGDRWDIALIDDVDRARSEVGAAFALVRIVARARGEGSSLLLAAREPSVVRELSDRVLTMAQGRLIDRVGTARSAVARVAECPPLTVIPGAPSIR